MIELPKWTERDRAVLGLALISVALLAAVEFGLYRPRLARLAAAEKQLTMLQSQTQGLERRRFSDSQILETAGSGADGAGLRRRYGAQAGLVRLNRLLVDGRLRRLELSAEAPQADGPFMVEKFYCTLQGPGPQLLRFLHDVERDERLMQIDQIRLEPLETSAELLLKVRISIYGLPTGGASP